MQERRLHLKQLFWIFLPALGWVTLLKSRSRIIDPYCGTTPEKCTVDSILLSIDQTAVTQVSGQADHWSFITQDTAGILALLVPLAFFLITKKNFRSVLYDWVFLLAVGFTNGMLTEATRVLVGRARPFVYQDPLRLGFDHAHYTSFYSGHTSFAAAMAGATWVILGWRNAPRGMHIALGTLFCLLATATGALRYLAGRHFPTDVIAGAFAGLITSLVIGYLFKKKQ